VNSDAKLLALSDSAWRMWGCGIVYCQFNLTNGFIPEHAIHAFGVRAKNKEAVAEELCRSLVPGKGPLWERAPGGYQVHDYLQWNESKEKVQRERSASKDRLQRFKKRKEKRVVNAVSYTVPNATSNGDRTPVHDHNHKERSTEQERSRSRARVFTGKRLKISYAQHQVLLDEHGDLADRLDLLALYATWDQGLVESGEVFDTLSFIKRRCADCVRALRAVGPLVHQADPEAQARKAERDAECERRELELHEQLNDLWLLTGDAVRRVLRAEAAEELKPFQLRMTEDARECAIEAAARRLLGERFRTSEQRRAEVDRLRRVAVAS
jgi:hypothetical protein